MFLESMDSVDNEDLNNRFSFTGNLLKLGEKLADFIALSSKIR